MNVINRNANEISLVKAAVQENSSMLKDLAKVKSAVLENNLMLKEILKRDTVAPGPSQIFCPAKTQDELHALTLRSDLVSLASQPKVRFSKLANIDKPAW